MLHIFFHIIQNFTNNFKRQAQVQEFSLLEKLRHSLSQQAVYELATQEMKTPNPRARLSEVPCIFFTYSISASDCPRVHTWIPGLPVGRVEPVAWLQRHLWQWDADQDQGLN